VLRYIGRRLIYMVPTLVAISIVAFVIIQLPPGDYLSAYISRLESQGERVDPALLEGLRRQYGLGEPIHVQYWTWITNIIFHGDFGQSFEYSRSVSSLIADRLPWSIGLTLFALVFVWVVAFPIGVYSAVRQYSIGDYVATTIGFLGLSIPNFMLALAMMYVAYRAFGLSTSGASPLTIGIAIVVLGTAGTAGPAGTAGLSGGAAPDLGARRNPERMVPTSMGVSRCSTECLSLPMSRFACGQLLQRVTRPPIGSGVPSSPRPGRGANVPAAECHGERWVQSAAWWARFRCAGDLSIRCVAVTPYSPPLRLPWESRVNAADRRESGRSAPDAGWHQPEG
jgi:hypothetical protein